MFCDTPLSLRACPQVGVVSSRYDASDPASPLQLLLGDVGTMLRAAAKQLSDKSPKTRMGMFTVLRTLVGVLPGSVADHVGMLVPGGSSWSSWLLLLLLLATSTLIAATDCLHAQA